MADYIDFTSDNINVFTGLNHEIFQKSLLTIENKWLTDFNL